MAAHYFEMSGRNYQTSRRDNPIYQTITLWIAQVTVLVLSRTYLFLFL